MSVTIGIDPHKSTHTAVAVDRDEHQIARLTLAADRHQTDRLLAWAEPLDADRVWAIESAAGLGRLLAQQLVAAGEHVVDVGAAGEIAGQDFADLVVQDVAFFLAHLYEPLKPVVFIV